MGELGPVQFKIEPIFIPATDIVKVRKFPNCTGGRGDIWKCLMAAQSRTRHVAVKSIRVPSLEDEEIEAIGKKIRREAYVWIKLKHNHILPFEGVTVAEEFGPLPALVSPWMEEGSLDDYLKRKCSGLSDLQKQKLIWQVTAGISYLHGDDIVHGDLTATNILVDSHGCLRLADFGLSMILAEAANATFNSCHAGNVRWMPPEALQADEEGYERPTKAWDVYSYGCVAFQIFSGIQPYSWIKSALAVMNAVQKGHAPFRHIQSDGVYQQFSPCLSEIPTDRPMMNDIMEVLGSWQGHP